MNKPLAMIALLFATAGAATPTTYQVSQSHRAFVPNRLEVHPGDLVRIVNDDGELVHHVFVDAPNLKIDSGEQEPGTVTTIRFPNVGTYMVWCQIHPKMRLEVTVR